MRVKIVDLKPTQLSVGYQQVDEKINKINDLHKKEIESFLRDHTVPIILGPNKEMYIVDHHHFCLAAHKSSIHEVYGNIINDWSKDTNFWDTMLKHKYVWLYDNHGYEIDLDTYLKLLPKTITELKDDPYRSLAGIVRKLGGFDKVDEFYEEFHWANYFRKKIPDLQLNKETIKYAMYLASDAEKLPGFKPPWSGSMIPKFASLTRE